LVLALVATTTLMSVQDRVKEHAVLQTIGFTGGEVFGLVLIESAVLSLTGGILGVFLAVVTLELVPMSVGAEAVTIAFQATGRLIAVGVAVSLVVRCWRELLRPGTLRGRTWLPRCVVGSRSELTAAAIGLRMGRSFLLKAARCCT
jgi:predicted lysophospholipase L1 biosynthesis ABC-type transport system permease subunit